MNIWAQWENALYDVSNTIRLHTRHKSQQPIWDAFRKAQNLMEMCLSLADNEDDFDFPIYSYSGNNGKEFDMGNPISILYVFLTDADYADSVFSTFLEKTLDRGVSKINRFEYIAQFRRNAEYIRLSAYRGFGARERSFLNAYLRFLEGQKAAPLYAQVRKLRDAKPLRFKDVQDFYDSLEGFKSAYFNYSFLNQWFSQHQDKASLDAEILLEMQESYPRFLESQGLNAPTFYPQPIPLDALPPSRIHEDRTLKLNMDEQNALKPLFDNGFWQRLLRLNPDIREIPLQFLGGESINGFWAQKGMLQDYQRGDWAKMKMQINKSELLPMPVHLYWIMADILAAPDRPISGRYYHDLLNPALRVFPIRHIAQCFLDAIQICETLLNGVVADTEMSDFLIYGHPKPFSLKHLPPKHLAEVLPHLLHIGRLFAIGRDGECMTRAEPRTLFSWSVGRNEQLYKEPQSALNPTFYEKVAGDNKWDIIGLLHQMCGIPRKGNTLCRIVYPVVYFCMLANRYHHQQNLLELP